LSNTVPTSIPRPFVRANQVVIIVAVVLSFVVHSFWWLLVPFIAGLLGLIFHWNPVLKIAKLFYRRPASTYYPEDAAGQQFNQYIATFCLGFSLIAFVVGWMTVAIAFAALVAAAATIAVCGFCVGCFIRYRWRQYRYRRSIRHSSF